MLKRMRNIFQPLKKVKRVLTKIFINIWNPIFPITGIIIAFIINSFFTKPDENYPKMLNTIIENRIIAIIILVAWMITSFLTQIIFDLKEKCNVYQKQIEENNRHIENIAGLIAAKYGEFSESIKLNNLKKICSSVIRKFPYLEAIHIYQYEYSYEKPNIKIKLGYYAGDEQEGVSTNVIKQNYYNINHNIIKNLNTIKSMPKAEALKKGSETLEEISRSVKDEGMSHRLQELLFYLLCNQFGFDNTILETINEAPKHKFYRTGILGAILLNWGYMYSYDGGNKDKLDRYYYATPIMLDAEYILNITIKGGNTSKKELRVSFESIVNEVKIEYNKLNGGDTYETKNSES